MLLWSRAAAELARAKSFLFGVGSALRPGVITLRLFAVSFLEDAKAFFIGAAYLCFSPSPVTSGFAELNFEVKSCLVA